MLSEGIAHAERNEAQAKAQEAVLRLRGSDLDYVTSYITILQVQEMAHLIAAESDASMRRHQGGVKALEKVSDLFSHEPVVARRATSRREV